MSPDLLADLLVRLGLAVRERLASGRRVEAARPVEPAAQQAGDAIYPIDLEAEAAIRADLESWPDECRPLLLVAEGFGDDGREAFGRGAGPFRLRLIVDPIDGTRGLMYDKRSAWFLAAACEDRGEATTLADSLAAVMVELPTSKQGWADVFRAVRDGPATGRRERLDGSVVHDLALRPSRAETLAHGFAQLASFFPGTKVLAAELMEEIVRRTLGAIREGEGLVFDDQYISTGGQMAELILGHDRFTADLRPLLHEIMRLRGTGSQSGLACHPYDMAGWLVAQQAGIEMTDGLGRALSVPLDVHTPVHWCAYANGSLRRRIEPIIQAWLRERGVSP